MILGIFLVLLGIVFFLKNLGIIVLPSDFWSFMWPLLLIVIGLYGIMAAYRGRQYKHWLFHHKWKKRNEE